MDKKIRPQDKWSKKAGFISKSYKLKKDLVETFANSCKENNISQASCLTILMGKYILDNKIISDIKKEEILILKQVDADVLKNDTVNLD